MIVEPRKDEFAQPGLNKTPKAASWMEAIRMRVVTAASFAVMIYLFIRVIF